MIKYRHLRYFPLVYEISRFGDIRKRTNNGFLNIEKSFEESGTYVYINVHGKTNKCLLAELLLSSFNGNYVIGYRITYRDGNINNAILDNLTFKRTTDINEKYLTRDKELMAMWRCESRASSANSRYAAYNQIITPNEVLRCLTVCKFKCFYCEENLNPHRWHLDHFSPLSKMGGNNFENLRAACIKCNLMKSSMEYAEFVKKAYQVYLVFIKHNPNAPEFNTHKMNLNPIFLDI